MRRHTQSQHQSQSQQRETKHFSNASIPPLQTDESLKETDKIPQVTRSKRPHLQPPAPGQHHLTQVVRQALIPPIFKRVPVLLQMNTTECGAACLAMILNFYGRKVSIAEVGAYCEIGRDGLSALDIVKAARDYGFRVRAVSIQENNFRGVTLPAIIHWQFNHFLVVERWSSTSVHVIDPALGRRTLSLKEFNDGFTGVVIILEPGAQFVRGVTNSSSRLTLLTYITQYLKRAPSALVQILLASLLLQLAGLALPLLTKVVIDYIIPKGTLNLLTLLGIGMSIMLLAQLVVLVLRDLLLVYLQTRIDTQMIPGFFDHLLSLPYSFFLQRSNGDLLTRFTSLSTVRDLMSSSMIVTLLDGSFAIAYLFILFSQALSYGLVVLLIGLVHVILLLTTSRMRIRLARGELEKTGQEQGYINEVLAGIETLKATGMEYRAFARWYNFFLARLNVSVRHDYLSSIIVTITSSLQTIAPLALLWIGTIQVVNGKMQLGTMLVLNTLAIAFLSPLASLVTSGQEVQLVKAHLGRIADVVEAQPEQHAQQVQRPPRLQGQIGLEHVSFRYDPQAPYVLDDMSLHIEPGQKIAIVGRTGSGKSTLGRLLLGLYQPTTGEISYDGLLLRSLNYQDVRSQFGVVLQNVSIFSGSIRQNITFDLPDISFEQAIWAATVADLHDDILRMPMGYETFVSEDGKALSGGQRQRLALARALVRKPAILLLDEATSSLDVETESVIERNLERLTCTQIIIAHRLSTIRNADCILVLDDGHLVEQGTHQELIKANRFYAHLIRNQLTSGEIMA